MNPLVKILIAADFFIFFGLGLVSPIFAVFVTNHLAGGSLTAAGIAAAVYLAAKAVFQLPIAAFTDREPGQLREFWTLIIGYFFIALVPFLYLLISSVKELYLVQAFYGLGSALAYPGWMSIFTKFADHEHAGFSWAFYSTTALASMAVAGSIGGYIGEIYGFRFLFWWMGVALLIGLICTTGLVLFYEELRMVKMPPRLAGIGERLRGTLRRRKYPLPPGASTHLPK